MLIRHQALRAAWPRSIPNRLFSVACGLAHGQVYDGPFRFTAKVSNKESWASAGNGYNRPTAVIAAIAAMIGSCRIRPGLSGLGK